MKCSIISVVCAIYLPQCVIFTQVILKYAKKIDKIIIIFDCCIVLKVGFYVVTIFLIKANKCFIILCSGTVFANSRLSLVKMKQNDNSLYISSGLL